MKTPILLILLFLGFSNAALAQPDSAFVKVPNVYNPDHATLSPPVYFQPQLNEVELVSFKVFNRWGESLFETETLEKGWDAVHKKKVVPNGVYVWMLQIRKPDGTLEEYSGNVTILQ